MFWDGVEYGVDKMQRLFKLKIERGVWKTSDDAAQIALLKTKDIKRKYVVEKTGVPLKKGRQMAMGRTALLDEYFELKRKDAGHLVIMDWSREEKMIEEEDEAVGEGE